MTSFPIPSDIWEEFELWGGWWWPPRSYCLAKSGVRHYWLSFYTVTVTVTETSLLKTSCGLSSSKSSESSRSKQRRPISASRTEMWQPYILWVLSTRTVLFIITWRRNLCGHTWVVEDKIIKHHWPYTMLISTLVQCKVQVYSTGVQSRCTDFRTSCLSYSDDLRPGLQVAALSAPQPQHTEGARPCPLENN